MPLAIAAGLLIGSVPFALMVARRWSPGNLRQVGSGNLGAANVLRLAGIKAGVLVAALDIAKGVASVMVANRLSGDPSAAAWAGFAAVIGHIYPVWVRFHGGKGVATACGVFSILTPFALPPAVGIFVVTVWASKYVSLGSVVAAIVLPPIAYGLGDPAAVVLVAFMTAAIIVFRHRSNLVRVRTGTERRLGAGA